MMALHMEGVPFVDPFSNMGFGSNLDSDLGPS